MSGFTHEFLGIHSESSGQSGGLGHLYGPDAFATWPSKFAEVQHGHKQHVAQQHSAQTYSKPPVSKYAYGCHTYAYAFVNGRDLSLLST